MCSMGTMLALYSGGSNLDGMHCAEQNSFETVRKGLKTADGRSLAEVTQARMEELKAVGRKKYKFHEYRKVTFFNPAMQSDTESCRRYWVSRRKKTIILH